MSRLSALLVYALMTAFFGCFFAYPLWITLEQAFTLTDGRFTFEFVGEVFMNPLYREGLANSFWLACWTTLGCLLLAVPLALLVARHQFPGKTWLNSLVLMPLVLPPFVGAIGVKAILGQAGALNALLIDLGWMDPQHPADWLGMHPMAGIILMEVLHLYPILYLNVAAALAGLDPALEEAASSLGCPPWRRLWRVTLPLVRPGLFAGGTLVFIWSFTELGVPLVFDFDRVTSVQIFRSLNDLSDNPFPYALVAVMLFFSTVIYAVGKGGFGSGGAMVGGGRAVTARQVTRLPYGLGWLASLVFALVILVAVLPHIGVILLSFADDWYATVLPERWTLGHYAEALGHELTLASITNSLKYSVAAVLLALVLGTGVAWLNVRTRFFGRQLLDFMAMMPLAVPGVVLAFGCLAMTRPGRPFDWMILDENPFLILVVAYAVRRLPFIVRSATAGFQQVNVVLEEAARSLGARPERALWRITLPLVLPHLLAGGLLAFSLAMLEVSDSMVLAQQAAYFPITKAIYFLVMALGNGPNLASALGVWAMVFLAVALGGAGLLLGRKLGALFR